jgi:hypothetical protein
VAQVKPLHLDKVDGVLAQPAASLFIVEGSQAGDVDPGDLVFSRATDDTGLALDTPGAIMARVIMAQGDDLHLLTCQAAALWWIGVSD